MWSLRHPVQFLILYKDVAALLIQAGLLAATFALIWVGTRQAKAAKAQARAANRQVKAAEAQALAAAAQVEVARQQVELLRAQVETANAQFGEMQIQGQTARLPIFKVKERNHAFENSAAVLMNVGPGAAFKIKWKFLSAKNKDWESRVYDIGMLAAGRETDMPWPDNPTHKLSASMITEGGISIDFEDAAKQPHTTIVKRTEMGEFISYPS
jgi:hypothetical protein